MLTAYLVASYGSMVVLGLAQARMEANRNAFGLACIACEVAFAPLVFAALLLIFAAGVVVLTALFAALWFGALLIAGLCMGSLFVAMGATPFGESLERGGDL